MSWFCLGFLLFCFAHTFSLHPRIYKRRVSIHGTGSQLRRAKSQDIESEDSGRVEVWDLEEDANVFLEDASDVQRIYATAKAATGANFKDLIINIDDLSSMSALVRLTSIMASPSESPMTMRAAISSFRQKGVSEVLPESVETIFLGRISKNVKRLTGFASRGRLAIVIRNSEDVVSLEEGLQSIVSRQSAKKTARRPKNLQKKDRDVKLHVYLTHDMLRGAEIQTLFPRSSLPFRGLWLESIEEVRDSLENGYEIDEFLSPGQRPEFILPSSSIRDLSTLLGDNEKLITDGSLLHPFFSFVH